MINSDSPTGLLRAVFFYNGKNFCLRGGIEHCNLKISQIQQESVTIAGKVWTVMFIVSMDQKIIKGD